MSFKPLMASLWRNRTGPVLVAFEIAFSLAVIVNAFYYVVESFEKANKPTGMDVANIFWILSEGYASDFNYPATVRADLELLNAEPGVLAATTISRLPMSGSGSTRGYSAAPGDRAIYESGQIYLVTERGVDTLGVQISEGKNFDAGVIAAPRMDYFEAMSNTGPEILLTEAMAKKIFPDGKAVGRLVYENTDRAFRVVGVIAQMQGIDPYLSISDQVVLLPSIAPGPSVIYMIRAQPGRRDELMGKLPGILDASQPGRSTTTVESFETTIDRTLTIDRSPGILVAIITALVTIVAGLGIFGLAMFTVTTRTRQIGVRRALGARKFDILNYFLLENWLITTAGVVVGCLLSLGIGVKLSLMFQSPRLPLYYLVAGVMAMWILGLCATLIPARRAAAVSPAVATRTV